MYILEINSSNEGAYYVYKNNYMNMIAALCTSFPSWKMLYSDKNKTFDAKLTECEIDGNINTFYDILTSYYQNPKDCNVFIIEKFTPICSRDMLDCNTYDYISTSYNNVMTKTSRDINQINKITKFSYSSEDDTNEDDTSEYDEYDNTDLDSDYSSSGYNSI